MTKQEQADRIAAFIEEMQDEFEVEVEVTGGGKGWTATADDGTEAKASSKMLALEALHNRLDENRAEVEDEPEDEDFDLEGECSEICQKAKPGSVCTCKCGGVHHPKSADGSEAVVLGPKPCKCGCGQITKRAFVAGHDAAFHFAERARANGFDDPAEYKKALKVERNKKAAAKRREQRAEAKALAVKIAEVAKTIA